MLDECSEYTCMLTATYSRLNCFPREISAERLTNATKECCKKLKQGYKIGSFLNLIEWRCTAYYLYNQCTSIHCHLEVKNIITYEYIFQPYLQYSMKENSELLSKHLRETLCLSQEEMIPNDEEENILGIRDTDRVALDSEILNYAMQLDLPIILSIDASLKNECAISSVSLIIPNIHPNDRDMEW